jgi:hypothetical protein
VSSIGGIGMSEEKFLSGVNIWRQNLRLWVGTTIRIAQR